MESQIQRNMLRRVCLSEAASKRRWKVVGAIGGSLLILLDPGGGVGSAAQPPVRSVRPATISSNRTSGEIRGWSLPYRKEGDLKAKLFGATARPLPGGVLEIRELRVDLYRDGEPRATFTTPLCHYRQNDDVVRSTNIFSFAFDQGRAHLEGEGFLLQLDTKQISSPGRFSAEGANGRPQVRGLGFWCNLDSGEILISNKVQVLVPVRLPQRPPP